MRTDKDRQRAPVDGLGRRTFLASAAGALSGAAMAASFSSEARAQVLNCAPIAGSNAWKQPGNNEHVRGLQSVIGRSGPVAIEYFGHCAFKITSPGGLTLMFDPWRNDPSGAFGFWFGREFPREVVDICLSTHTHFDHDALYHVDATSVLDRAVGTWSFADVTITGIPDKHAISGAGYLDLVDAVRESGADPLPPHNPGHLDMVSYVVETGGIRILIWGDNRHNPPEEVWRKWGRIDVLTLPIDASSHVLNYSQADEVIARLKPNIVIPTHYLIEGTSLAISVLRTADDWVRMQTTRTMLIDSPRLILNAPEVAALDRATYYFGSNVNLGKKGSDAPRMSMAPG